MRYSTADLCDAHPEQVRVLDPIINGCSFNNYGGRRSFWGEIVTIKCHEDNSLVKDQANQPGQGKVMVVDGGGSMRRALLGDMIAEKATQNAWEGIVIYGCIRDADAIGVLDLGVKALNTNPLKTEKRGMGDLNRVLTFGGVSFNPGEYLYADNDGVIVSSEALKKGL